MGTQRLVGKVSRGQAIYWSLVIWIWFRVREEATGILKARKGYVTICVLKMLVWLATAGLQEWKQRSSQTIRGYSVRLHGGLARIEGTMSNRDEVDTVGYGLVLGCEELPNGWHVLEMNQQQSEKSIKEASVVFHISTTPFCSFTVHYWGLST